MNTIACAENIRECIEFYISKVDLLLLKWSVYLQRDTHRYCICSFNISYIAHIDSLHTHMLCNSASFYYNVFRFNIYGYNYTHSFKTLQSCYRYINLLWFVVNPGSTNLVQFWLFACFFNSRSCCFFTLWNIIIDDFITSGYWQTLLQCEDNNVIWSRDYILLLSLKHSTSVKLTLPKCTVNPSYVHELWYSHHEYIQVY